MLGTAASPVTTQNFVIVFGPWRRIVEVEKAPLQPGSSINVVRDMMEIRAHSPS
jgi:hypothetical protein